MKVRFSVCAISAILALFVVPSAKLSAATPTVPPGACLYALDSTAADVFQIAGAQSVYTACGVVAESSSSSAFEMEGAETLYLENHAQVSVVGGADLTGQTYLYDTIGGKDVSAVKTSNPGDPLSNLSPPTSGAMAGKSPTYYDMNSKPANNTISPGIYCGGLTIGNTNGATFTFSPGVYIIAGGGLTLESEAVVKGTGVTFYNTSSAGWGCSSSYNYTPITISGQVNATFSAPTSGALDGILFFGNRTGCSTAGSCVDQVNGGSTAILNGALYFKSDKIEITGANASGYTMLVADKIYINGNSNFGENGSPFDDITVSVSPAAASIFASQTQQFTATVDNTGNTAVTWTISPSSAGSISSSGLYTAPSSITAQQTVNVTATSQADNTKTATATITLLPPQTPVITWAAPAAITYGTALSATQLDATANVPGAFTYTPAAGTVLAVGNQKLSVTFAPANMAEYTTVTASVTLTVNKATPVIAWATPGAITYGTALSATQLDATANVAGTFTYSPAAGSVMNAGTQTLTTTFTPTNTTDYTTVTASVTLMVNQAAPTISPWPTASPINEGQTLASSNLSGGSASVSGTFAWTTPTTIPGVGTPSESVTFTPTSTANYNTVTGTVSVTVNPPITVSVTPPTATLYANGTQQFTATVANTSNQAVTWTISPAVGTISASGVYTAPATISSQQTVTVTAASQASSSATATATVTLLPAITVSVTPPTATLYANGTQQFTATVANTSNQAVTWTISPAVGTISASGVYTAPATISSQQTVTVTAASQASSSATATATVTLLPAITVSVTPPPATLYANGTQQFTATVANTSNQAVTWTISPAVGTISASGVYTAPATISSQQTVTVTATSQASSSASATATVTLLPAFTQCNTNGYTYARAITIDHTKVPNTDQTNFPFLFNTTDPLLATTSNGGHVANFYGYDIIFTSDPAGLNPLPYEMEEYNPQTGTVIAWVQIPDLSHSSDTTIYLFYGNPNINTSQQNPSAVWDSNYLGVWHLANSNGSVSVMDSTANGNNGNVVGASATAGQIDGALNNPHATSGYIDLGATPLATAAPPSAFTVEAWVNIAGLGSYPAIVDFDATNSNNWGLYVEGGGAIGEVAGNGMPWAITSGSIPSGWNQIIATSDANGPMMYLNGVMAGQSWNDSSYDNSVTAASIGLGYGNQLFNGSIDEVRVSNIVRSSDWIAAEYANQSAPSTFYELNLEDFVGVVPTTVALSPSQSQQFTALNGCSAVAATWSLPAGSPGALTTAGLYTAPTSIATQQTVNITASSQIDGTIIGNSTITLLPPMTISPAAPMLYTSYQTLQFTAMIGSSTNIPVTWSIDPANIGSISQAGLYTAPSFDIAQTVTVTATNAQNPTQSASTVLTLMPVLVTPYDVTMYGGYSQQFTADVPVIWTLSQNPVGAISQTGIYAAPITSSTTFDITATAQADPNAFFTTWINVWNPIVTPITPAGISLYGGQSQSFNACLAASAYSYGCSGNSNGPIWSINPAGAGTISSTGVYTAPPLIPAQQIVAVTSTSPGNPAITSSGTITLLAPVVSLKPQSVTLYADQAQQFTSVVTKSSNAAVNWSISPAGVGSVSSNGEYTAPSYVASQQTVTITATLQAIPSITASAVIALSPAQCPGKAYSFERPIVIDHTKVPGSDEPNFPFYFGVTDPSLESTSNGGHVNSLAGNDIVFTSDPGGLQPLPFDLEQYNPATGQIVAWIKVPVLSHSQDTVIYMFYGNPAITAPQQNPTAAWDSNYTAVYQFDNLQNGSLLDSTINGNNAPSNNVQTIAGQPGAAGVFDGQTSYVTLPTNNFSSYPTNNTAVPLFNASFGVWFKTSSTGVILGQTGTTTPQNSPNGSAPALYIDTNGYLRATFFYFQSDQQIVSPNVLNDNSWHYAVLTFETDNLGNTVNSNGVPSGIETLYVDGLVIGQISGLVPNGYTSSYSYFLGTGYTSGWTATPGNNNNWFYFGGSLDEVEVSSIARSGGWVQAEYSNQSSPSTFFGLGTEASVAPSLDPLAVALSQSASQQFAVLQAGACNAGDAVWSMPSGSPGTLSPTGIYTAPATINTQQTVTVTATTLGANSTTLNATITLMPPVAISVMPGVVSLPNGGTQQFTANVLNTTNTAATWSLDPAGIGSINSTGLYTAPATFNGEQTVSVIATSVADPTQSASANITLGVAASLIPALSITPPAATLYAGQTQQFTANLTNIASPSVTWSVNPSGLGGIDANGNYTAPASLTTEQTVTITATSQSDTTLAASASVILVPSCTSNGYSYNRAITINHNLVPNTDQANFPFLFNTTDPLLATTTNGGHVSNPNGYDIIFTSDPAGQNPLPYEMEEYNPATGQVVAWVQIPDLSHIADTVIYLFYGNSNITASQQNPTAVWGQNYLGVWHLPNGYTLSADDSTANANNGILEGGVSATRGEIDGSAVFDGSSGYIATSNAMSGPAVYSLSLWFNTTTTNGGKLIGFGSSQTGSSSSYDRHLYMTDSGQIVFGNYDGGTEVVTSPGSYNDGHWHSAVGTLSSAGQFLYIDGTRIGSSANTSAASYSGYWKIGYDNLGSWPTPPNSDFFGGSLDEVRVSAIAESADEIATEYANQSSPSNFYSVAAEETLGVLPASVTLYPNQSQQFEAPGLCSPGVSWSLSSGAQGTLSSSGAYSAPSTIAEQETVTVTAASVANPGQAASATVTLMPPVSVGISPASITLNQNQTQQFIATVNNSTSQAVTWTMSPAGLGSLDQNGGYIAPSSIATQQTVTITATSVTDPTKSASAMVTLSSSVCASTGYGYQRVIVIDYTKVPNTDQINYPFLFNSTDPDLASVDNGGHVASPNGYDIIFSTDPNGQTKLDTEIEQYNPVTGQLVAWVRIPTLSHSMDTVIYVFYGNPAITTPQANPAGVWDSNYQAVYHLGNLPSTDVASDSTNYANNASYLNFAAEPGKIDGSAGLDGVTSYLQIPSTAFPNYPTSTIPDSIPTSASGNGNVFAATFGIWFKTNSWGGLLQQTSGETCTFDFFVCITYGAEQVGDVPYGSWSSLLQVNFDGDLAANGVSPTTQAFNDNNWHLATVTFEDGISKLYADGQLVGSGQPAIFGFSPTYAYFVGTVDAESDSSSQDSQPWKYLPGQIDEINVSNIARSGDWIQTQFNNQSSPATFYKFYSPNAVQVAPSSIGLYASQSELFTVPGTCDATIVWSLPSGAPGTLSAAGLYTAPSSVSGQQTVAVNATSQSNGSNLGSAQVTLLPAPQPLTLLASSPSPYQVGGAQSFTASLVDTQGNPLAGVTVNFTVAGPNETVASVTTSATGTASFTYTGANSGTDTVQATASVDGSLLTSNSVTAAWVIPPPAQTPTLTLLPQPSLGRGALMGAFTDSNGDVVEPIEIGAAARTFITPAGATQLQLGINDTYYTINGGAGFLVAVNGSNVSVPPTAMPWKWKTGGLNNNYQYGINDGTSPVIAPFSLTAGQPVAIAYQSGTISTNYPVAAPVNANGDPSSITGTQILDGAYFPTLYTTGTAYPQNQPINAFATVVDATGAPIPNTPVTLTISGANPGQLQATTDATGIASFLYTGQYAGNDSLQAQATLAGQETLESSQTAVDWTNYPTPPPVGSLPLEEQRSNSNYEYFDYFVYDASGNFIPNVNVGFYVSGVDNYQTSITTNNIGQAFFTYLHDQSGTSNIFAVDTVDRNVIVTQQINDNWTLQSEPASSAGGDLTVGISGDTSVTIPNSLQLTGTVTDNSGLTPTLAWTQVSGPGTVTFAAPNQASTTANFSQVGTYVLELSANDNVNSGWAQFTVNVLAPSVASQAQGWIGSPAYGSAVTGIVPITLAPGVTLTSGTLSYGPANNPNNTTVLNANVSGSGQIGSLDTTALANGSYLIQMQGTDTNANSQYSLILVTVTGNYKPGRVTTTVTDLVVPATGLAINIQRTYDSLNSGTSGDFGYGWNLGIGTNLTVDNSGNVTFTIGGQRKTFNLTPTYGGWLFPWYFPAYTPQPGAFGTLTDTGSSCPLDLLAPNGSIWDCYGGSGQFNPSGYIYTDPSGTQYTIGAGGQLQSIADRSGNGLTITANGITSTTGLNVPFVRDGQNRIVQITDPAGNVYSYSYDANGDLVSVTYPPAQSSQVCAGASAPNTSQYTYAPNHYYESGTDGNCNPLPSTTYYAAGETDASGNYSVAGKLQSVTDGLGETTGYTYNLATNTTVVTYPPDAQGNIGTATMVYDSNGDVLSSADPLGHTTTNTYDTNFNLLSTTDPLGHTTSYTYDANGNKLSTTYPATAASTNTTSATNYNQFSEPTSTLDEDGNTRTFAYDANFNPLAVTDAVGTLMSTTFNAAGQMLSGAIGYDITQNPANASQFAYDANGNLTSKTDALGRTTSYTYNALGQKLTMTEPVPTGSTAAQATTTYTYDAFGNVIETQAPLGRVTYSTYDANGNKLTDTDARGNVTSYKYDALNRLIETDYPDGTKSTKTYDFRNNVVTETDQNGNVTLHQYDLAGRQVAVTQAYGAANATTTTTAYDNAGRMTSQTDALGHATTYTYDAAGNLLSTSGVAGNFTYAYDNARNKIAQTDGNGDTTKYQFDSRKRLTTTTYPDGTLKTNSYDGPGNLISVTDQAGNIVNYSYDAANQLSSVTESPSTSVEETTIYGYDLNGNPIALEDANTHTTLQSYDLASELTGKLLPDATLTETRTYDNNGNLSTVTHFNNVTTTYTYDQLNRLLSRATPGEAPVSFTYTATGKYLTSTAGDGTVNYSYDSLDRLLTKATPEGTLSYTYYANGNVETIASSNSNGASVALTWDELNRLSTVIDNRLPSGANTATYTYDPAGNVATATYPNGFQTTFTYDQLSRLTAMSTPVSSYNYQRGPTGNLLSTSESSGRQVNWTYDGIYRLTNETISLDPSHNNGAASYTLDPVGNRLSANSTLPGINPIAGTYNADDELSSETYDANGNVLSADGMTYTYDSESHMISATGNGKVITMVYDAFGNRVSKTVNGVTTQYLVEDDVNPTGLPQVFDELTNGAVTRTYTYGLQRISESQMLNGVWTTSFYGYDGGGNVRQLTNSAGTVTDTYEYDAFGNVFTVSGTTPNVYLYRGEQYDSDLGLYYLRARYYNPATGRFMSRDSNEGNIMIPATLHKYLYTGGDPVNRIDPRGSEDEIEYGGVTKKNLTHDEAYAAQQLRFLRSEYKITTKILKAAIEDLKQSNKGSFANNPDVWIDISNGNVYLEEEYDYEFLDNLDEYLP